MGDWCGDEAVESTEFCLGSGAPAGIVKGGRDIGGIDDEVATLAG